jgi:acyl-homoserine-lactone acylase
VRADSGLSYRYGTQLRPVRAEINVPYRAKDGSMGATTFTLVFHPRTGRSCGAKDGKWIAVALMNKPIEALEQSCCGRRPTDYAAIAR